MVFLNDKQFLNFHFLKSLQKHDIIEVLKGFIIYLK